MSKNTASEVSGTETAVFPGLVPTNEATGSGGAGAAKAKRSRSAAKRAKAPGKPRKAGPTAKATRKAPKEGAKKAAGGRKAARKADAKGGTARKRPGPAAKPLKAGEPPTPMAKPLGSPKAAANAGPAVEAALETFDGSRALLAKFLGIQSQNLGRILRSHRAGWAEKIPDQFVARLSAVSGIPPAEINPFVFLPNWKVPKMSKKEALSYATGEKPLPWAADGE